MWAPLTKITVDKLADYNDVREKLTPAWKTVLWDCNGHPRMIESVFSLFEHFKDANKEASMSYMELVTNLDMILRGNYTTITEAHIKPTVLKTRLGLLDKIGRYTFADLIAMGMYLNSLTCESSAIPELSIVQIARFSNKYGCPSPVDTLLPQMLRLEASKTTGNYEWYCACHIALFRQLAGEGSTSLLNWFPGLYNDAPESKERWDPDSVTLHFGPRKWKVYEPSDGKHISTKANEDTFELRDNDVLVGSSNQPGCDSLLCDKTGVFVGIENKYSELNGKQDPKAPLTIEDVNKKWENFKKQMTAIENCLTRNADQPGASDRVKQQLIKLRAKEYYLVFIARQKFTGKGIELPKKVMVIDNDRLAKYFGLTFSSRPLYWAKKDMGII